MGEQAKRNIYYYDIVLSTKKVEIDKNSNRKRKKTEKLSNQGEVLRGIFQDIKRKQDAIFKEENDAKRIDLQKDFEVETDRQDKLYVLVDELKDDEPIKFRLILCRTDTFPFIYRNGQLDFMTDEISGDFSLAEITHCVMFPDNMVMGAEFNFNGARPSAIATYISFKSSDVYFMQCNGKINNEAIDKIASGVPLSLFDLCIKNTEYMNMQIESNKFGITSIFRTMPPEVGEYEIIMKRRKSSKQRGFDSPFTKEQYKKFIEENRDYIGRFRVSQGTYKDAIDLLNDKLVHTVPIDIKTTNKTIDRDVMYSEIIKFFNTTVISYCDKGK